MSSGEKSNGGCKRVKLGEIAQVNPKAGAQLSDDDKVIFLPLASVNVDGTISEGLVSNRGEVKKGHPYFRRGDILVAKITPSFENGKVALASIPLADGYSSTEFHVVRADTEHVRPDYLLAFLRSPQVVHYCSGKMKGSAGQKRVPKEVLQNLQINLPPLSEQAALASILNAVANSIRAAQAQVARFDSLVKARFIEMFGNPVNNSKQLATKPGSRLFKIGNGTTKPAAERYETGIPAYGGNGISWYSKDSLTDSPTIVIGRVGRHCGNTRLVNEPCWVTDNAMYIKEFYGDDFDLIYLDVLMQLVGFNRFADRGDLWKITQQPFMDFNYLLPPMSEQQDFAAFAQQVAKSRSIAQQQIEKLQLLYDSLAQEYFG